ncbi:MAG: 1-deoxy-D-xylulose-5-phosphate reductoisomerase [Erysipelotrichaceae bacterium]|nr:1-deoxy-D-xylulose-5-phosphate reductoisomerase [Erysipelotrichaceae bacterium]
MKNVIVLGASGSIGQQTLDVINQHPDLFRLVAVSVGERVETIRKSVGEYPLQAVCVQYPEDAEQLTREYPDLKVFSGSEGLLALLENVKADVVVNAILGFAGFLPTLKAIEKGMDVCLANKETLVAGGEFVTKALYKYGKRLYPIDSEHSAIFQCLQGNQDKEIKRLIITASGGSFRDCTREQLKNVTVKEALSHPNWTMGSKITIDSATMLNKGFEIIEAHWLFGVPYEKIDVILHRESIVHSMVEFEDNAILAQLGTTDMRLPIQYALTYPNRLPLTSEPLDLCKTGALHFEPLSEERYPMVKLAYTAGKAGGTYPAVLNGANEEAVTLFLEEAISFLDIEKFVKMACDHVPFIANPEIEDVVNADRLAREFVRNQVKGA